ncbi:mediator of RNA polymerase II transcription subunit 27-B [Hydra vulgaris]|uniref:Mediator of RNA polymerase II transcription subunit 27-B n=1 Tax=Hydra vulgaris TaxID=6087 RepID=A0ABM4D2A4_HYDVU
MASSIPKNENDITSLSSDLNNAVNQIKDIQSLMASFIDTIVVRKNDEAEKEFHIIKDTMKQIHEIRFKLDGLGNRYSQLRLNQIIPVPLGNTGYVCLDPAEEQSLFYERLSECYNWLNGLNKVSNDAVAILKRKNSFTDIWKCKKLKDSEVHLIDLVNLVKLDFPELVFNTRKLQNESCLELEVPLQFSLTLYFYGFKAVNVVVRSIEENFVADKFGQSSYFVFQSLSDIFTSVLINLNDKEPQELLQGFLKYLTPYKELFSVKCVICKKHLSFNSDSLSLLPPLRKDMTSSLFYHLSCK